MTTTNCYTTTVIYSYLTVVRDNSSTPWPSSIYSPALMQVFTDRAASLGVDRTMLVQEIERRARDRGVSVQILLGTMGWV
jgi:hypothetical protein